MESRQQSRRNVNPSGRGVAGLDDVVRVIGVGWVAGRFVEQDLESIDLAYG